MSNGELAPTSRLRFVERDVPNDDGETVRTGVRILQQFWAPDVPGYMRDPNVGEWRDVEMGVEAP